MDAARAERILKYLGLSAKAGRLVIGTSLICTALSKQARDKTPVLVLWACDASANTQKRLHDRSTYYGVAHTVLEGVDCSTLAVRVGKGDAAVAAVGVTDGNLARAILAVLQENDSNN